jgi:hypothetical protein
MINKIIISFALLLSIVFSQNNSNEFDIAVNTINKISLKDKDFEDAFDDLIYDALNQFTQLSNQFSWSKQFNLTRPEDVADILKLQDYAEQLEDCTEEQCGIVFGVIVQADYTINRKVTDFAGGAGYKVSLDFKSISTNTTLGSGSSIIRLEGSDKIEVYENIEEKLLNLVIDIFNKAFRSEPTIPKSTFLNQDIGVLDGPTIQSLTTTTKHGSKKNIRLDAVDPNNILNQPRKYIYSIIEKPKYGSAIIDNNILVYTPEANWTGDVVIRYNAVVIRDGKRSLNSNPAKITISVVNEPPKAKSSSQSVQENSRKVFNLSASDADGDQLTYRAVSKPVKGTISINKLTGRVEYIPFNGKEGEDSFTFSVNDGLSNSNVATILIDIDPLKNPPTADGFSVSTLHDKPTSFYLRGVDADGDAITYVLAKKPNNGKVGIENNKVTYVPDEGFYGRDELYYFVRDDSEAGLTSSRAKIVINVTNNKPQGSDYNVFTNMDQSVKVELKGDDRDKSDIVKLAYILEKNPSFGTFKRDRNSRNMYTYKPSNGFTGPDQLAYRIYDGAQYSDVHVITINVKGQNVVSNTRTQTPKQTKKPPQRTVVDSSKKDNDEGGISMGLILGVLLLVVLVAAGGGGGGGGDASPTGGVDIGITVP